MATVTRYLRAALVALAVACVSLASALPARALSAEDEALIQKAEDYLNGLTTVAARFMQVAPDGGMATGSFYLDKPGKMRVEYDPPVDILMVSTGRGFFFYDGSVEQTTQIPISETPAYFLVQEKIEFGENVLVKRLTRGDDTVKLLIADADQPDRGEVELIFAREPFELVRWSIYDPDGKETRVALLDAVYGKDLEDRLFLYISPTVKGPNE